MKKKLNASALCYAIGITMLCYGPRVLAQCDHAADTGYLPLLTTGCYDTELGTLALIHTTTGNANTALGGFALELNIDGNNNTAVGREALSGIPTTGFKEIPPSGNKQFRYKKPNANGEKPLQYGLIAEEVAEVFPELVVNNQEGRPETVAYHLLPAMLLNELQKEHAQLTAQETVIRDQARQIGQLQAQAAEVEVLKARLEDLERLTTLLARTAQPASQRVVDAAPLGVH
jgi:hypothetical protein